ncbi:hypothetical protein DFP91_2583 [Pseudorhodoplanes sinuspersici]|nr:hypothetical protein DFP91_2583 [Pseudorhodoplanes sinuspersici]
MTTMFDAAAYHYSAVRPFTSPWRGEVVRRRRAGGGESRSEQITPPRLAASASRRPSPSRGGWQLAERYSA